MGYEIKADLYERPDASETLLTFAGFGGNKKYSGAFGTTIAQRAGMNALVLDLSGHGESPFDLDDTTPAQHIAEGVSAYDWLKAAHPDHVIHALGTSYGGYVAAYLTRFRVIDKLLLRTPAIYEPRDLYNQHRDIDKIAVREYRNDASALQKHPLFTQDVLCMPDTLVTIHGRDEDIPPATTDIYQRVFEAETYTAEGFAHAFHDASNPEGQAAAYFDAVHTWMAERAV